MFLSLTLRLLCVAKRFGLPEHFNKIFLSATILWAILELKQNKDTIIQ